MCTYTNRGTNIYSCMYMHVHICIKKERKKIPRMSKRGVWKVPQRRVRL